MTGRTDAATETLAAQADAAATSLSRLHDIVVPAGPAWWPPAPGWFVLGGIALIATIVGVVLAIRRRRALAWRRAALAELASLRRTDDPARARAAAGLLRRAAIAAHGRSGVAALTGDAWASWLDERGATPDAFRAGAGRALAIAAYGADGALDDAAIAELLDAIEAWIRAQATPATTTTRERRRDAPAFETTATPPTAGAST